MGYFSIQIGLCHKILKAKQNLDHVLMHLADMLTITCSARNIYTKTGDNHCILLTAVVFKKSFKPSFIQYKFKVTHGVRIFWDTRYNFVFVFFYIDLSSKKILNSADNLCIFVVLCILKPEFNIAWIQFCKNSLTTNT